MKRSRQLQVAVSQHLMGKLKEADSKSLRQNWFRNLRKARL